MRRSICYCEPATASAGETNTWKFIYTPSATLPKGTRLRFDLQSKGRSIDWEIPTTNLKKSGGAIYAKIGKGKILQATEVEQADNPFPLYDFILPAPMAAGDHFVIVLGAREGEKGKSASQIQAQTIAQRRRSFSLYVDPSGKGRFDEPEVFTIDVKGEKLDNIRILAPSFVLKNKRFDVIVRFEDEHGNLTNNAPENTLIELTHEHLRENLSWKLFVSETGFISLPNLYFNEEGVYTICLKIAKTNKVYYSAPIRCFAENSRNLFWGLLHGESERYDSTENMESCLRHFRDERAFNFFASSPFEGTEETSNEIWKSVSQNITEFDEGERFTTFLGFQWVGEEGTEGVRQFLFSKDNKALLRKKDTKYSSLEKIYRSFTPKEMISIPTFTMGEGLSFDFSEYNPDFERVVEIYNAWGSSECTKKEGNDRPILSPKGKGVNEAAEGAIQKALLKNCRFGFVAGGLDDRGIYADLYDCDQVQYNPGLTGIISQGHSREQIFDALYKRSCYATTGQRMIMGLYVAGKPMGSETSTAEKRGLVVNRHLSGYVAGTTKLKLVEIIRNGKVLKSFKPTGYSFDFTYDDMEPLEKVAFNAKDKKPPFVYYYLRALQEDDHKAWSSPIWVDYIPASELPKLAKAKSTPKPTPPKKLEIEDEIEEEEDEDEDDEF